LQRKQVSIIRGNESTDVVGVLDDIRRSADVSDVAIGTLRADAAFNHSAVAGQLETLTLGLSSARAGLSSARAALAPFQTCAAAGKVAGPNGACLSTMLKCPVLSSSARRSIVSYSAPAVANAFDVGAVVAYGCPVNTQLPPPHGVCLSDGTWDIDINAGCGSCPRHCTTCGRSSAGAPVCDSCVAGADLIDRMCYKYTGGPGSCDNVDLGNGNFGRAPRDGSYTLRNGVRAYCEYDGGRVWMKISSWARALPLTPNSINHAACASAAYSGDCKFSDVIINQAATGDRVYRLVVAGQATKAYLYTAFPYVDRQNSFGMRTRDRRSRGKTALSYPGTNVAGWGRFSQNWVDFYHISGGGMGRDNSCSRYFIGTTRLRHCCWIIAHVLPPRLPRRCVVWSWVFIGACN